MRYSGFKVFKKILKGHKGRTPTQRDPEPKSHYDIVIIGGGGQGLAPARNLAKQFSQANVAVIEKAESAAERFGRKMTVIRSNYLLDGNETSTSFR